MISQSPNAGVAGYRDSRGSLLPRCPVTPLSLQAEMNPRHARSPTPKSLQPIYLSHDVGRAALGVDRAVKALTD